MSNTLKKTADLSAEEKRALLARLLREKEKAGGTRAREAGAHRLFEAQAARTPEAVAVAFEGEELTFAQLDARANRLANYLKALGVGPEVLVGLCVERSAAMVVGLLGILKAGGAYVPIDPEYPRERVAYMLEDSRVKVLLTEQALREAASGLDATVVCIDADWEAIALKGDQAPAVTVSSANLAYVIYTSGSTGKPKGVQIPHGALVNFLRSMKQILGIAESDVLLAVTTLSFDIAGLELFLPLTVGARVALVDRDTAADGNRLIEAMEEAGATFLQATPATWRLLLEPGWAGRPNLSILCGGEALPRELADRLLDRGAVVWNLYGPTETTIWSSAAKVEREEGPVAIGKPIAATQLYVLDNHLRPVPIGVIGELYIGGAGLARGYLARPGLTAERFIPDPVGQEPGSRVYRTGDLARWRPDGRLECLGRVDHQVKVRGFRIELGEVESALLRQPGVREAVVVAREDATGENRLIAYVVPRAAGDAEAPALAVADLRRALHETLPEPMVPSVFVKIDAMPLTPNGKVDRKALPDPEQVGAATDGIYVPPRGPIEEALAAAWGEVLGRDKVGVHDSFFDLGGHSLLAARLLARLRDAFGVELPLRALFDVPTVAGQAHRIEDALREGAGVQAPPLRPVPRDGDLPASFAQQRLWFLDQLSPGSPLYSIPLALRLEGALDVAAMGRALNEVVRRHESLRTTFRAEDGRPLQVIAPGLEIDVPIVDLSAVAEEAREAEVVRRAHEEARKPFDLARGPLVRAELLRLGDASHVLLLNMHHIISDGWSLGVLINESGILYDAFTKGRPSPLAELPIQYADFAAWQREWLQGDVLQAQLDYWKEKLTGVPTLELATDRPRPSTLSIRGDERIRVFPRELVDGLRAVGKPENATFFMTLMAGFEAFLHRYSGQEDFAVGTPIAGRTHSETEGLVGFFVNTLVLRADISGNPTFRELLRRVKQETLDAFARQDLPFEQMVNAVHPERDPSRTPLFQVMLVLQNAPLPAMASPELTMTPFEAHGGTAKFDLLFLATEKEDGLKLSIEFNTDLFDGATIDRMLNHFETLLGGIAEDPEQTIAALPMLSEAERRLLLGQWGDVDDATGLDDLDALSEDDLDSLIDTLSREEGDHDE